MTCVKTIEFSLKSEAKKANLHAHKIIIITPAIYERGLLFSKKVIRTDDVLDVINNSAKFYKKFITTSILMK